MCEFGWRGSLFFPLKEISIFEGRILKKLKQREDWDSCFKQKYRQGDGSFSLLSRPFYCQRFSPSQISNTLRAGFEYAQKLSSDFFEWGLLNEIVR